MLFFFITIFPFFSYSMQNHVLLLESADRVYRRNAQEVEKNCLDFLNYFQKKYPFVLRSEGAGSILRPMGQSKMTTEEKREAINALMQLKLEIKNKCKREKEKEAEDYEILVRFGLVNVDGKDRKKNRRYN